MILAVGCALSAGCHRVVRVEVSKEDIRRAAEAAQEGDIAFGRRDFYAALIKYLDSIRANPNNELVYNRLGIAYSQLKYYGEASSAFMRSIELNPKYPFSYNNLGSVYFAQKNLKKAEKYFKKALSLNNNEASFHMNMGSLYMERKQDEKGMAEWRKAMTLDPNVLKNNTLNLVGNSASAAERRFNVARLLAPSGDVDQVIENLKQAITEGFTNLDAIRKEKDFDPIRDDKRFIDFMENAAVLIRLRAKAGLPEL
jgi:tetratricopeptide (TPR) repeat protein